jgi:hypothetical protein
MKKLFVLFCLSIATVLAQTQTTNTTLCAATTATARSVCLSSTTGVVNQTGLYVDGEYMTVNLSSSQTLAATNAYVPVQRAAKGRGAPSVHNNAAVVWVALTPASAVVSGSNGFSFGTNLTDIGPCVRTSEVYLPHIWPTLNVIRDCAIQPASTTGVWTDYYGFANSVRQDLPILVSSSTGAQTYGAVPGVYVFTGATAQTVTLTAPTAGVMDGMVIKFISGSAAAHSFTCTSHMFGGTSTSNVATFAAYKGASITLMAYNGDWLVIASTGVTLT